MSIVTPESPVIADGMHIEWDIPIPMDDGNILRADLFRPIGEGKFPVILSMGPYGKGLSFQEGYPTAWDIMIQHFPEVAEGTSNKYQNWEVVDPEKWVPDGYACLRIDARGTGRSPGYFECHSQREIKDLYESIEWAAHQSWSNGNIGMAGISYYAQNQWYVAKHNPPSLKAMCVWEGLADLYRDCFFSGGILNQMAPNVYDIQMRSVQYGRGENGPRSVVTGQLVCGDVTLSEEELLQNCYSMRGDVQDHPFDGDYYRSRSAEWSKTHIPFLSVGNWGGQPLHTRGNVEGFVRAASEQKWLEMHGHEHWTGFYTDYGNALQKRFFDYFLKGEQNGWDAEPRVQLHIRHPGEKFVLRMENEWPLARTEWTRFYLDPGNLSLTRSEPPASAPLSFEAMGKGLSFSTPPLDAPLELTGPAAAKLKISSSTSDADLFLVLRVFDPNGKEVLFRGALDPQTPVAQGWLRASMRKLDASLSEPYRPYHSFEGKEPLEPGVPVDLDVEVWPTSIVVPAGHRLVLTILGRDFEHDEPPAQLSNMRYPMKGCGPFLHADPDDRPPEIFGGTTTIHFDGEKPYLLLPVIPG